MGDFPMMTDWGTFIINGTERVIVTQLVRSPGAYLMEPKDPTKQVSSPTSCRAGALARARDRQEGHLYARIDRKRKLPITTLLRALAREETNDGFKLDSNEDYPQALRQLDLHRQHARQGHHDPRGRGGRRGLQQRPGEPPTLDNARNLLRGSSSTRSATTSRRSAATS